MDPDREEQQTPPRLALELHREGAGIAGRLQDEFGVEHPFTGWLELLSLLEAARERSGRAPGSDG